MARGWESKSVENQIDSAEHESHPSKSSGTSAEKLAADRERAILQLSRTQVQLQLEAAQNERYRDQLMHALADLDAKIEKLGPKE